MVRKVLACTKCHKRFISKSGVTTCDGCQNEHLQDMTCVPTSGATTLDTMVYYSKEEICHDAKRLKSCHPTSKQISGTFISKTDNFEIETYSNAADQDYSIPKTEPGVKILDEKYHDKVYLDLLLQSGNESSDSEDVDEGFTLSELAAINQKKFSAETDNSVIPEVLSFHGHTSIKSGMRQVEQVASLSEDVCMVCGTSFQRMNGLKGRLNHIKRCSKKNGFSGRDTLLDEHDDFIKQPIHSAAVCLSKNPYSRHDVSWHGNADVDLTLAATETLDFREDSGDGLRVAQYEKSIQTSMKNFFHAPLRSLNKVLLLGARRVAKASVIAASTKKQGRGVWAGGLKYGDYTHCPGYKKITGTDFNVDGFMYAHSSLTKSYWLTHFHSDHYGGITKDWNHGIIYCSLPTANLVNQQLGVDKKWLHPLPIQTPTIVESKGKPVVVTLLDANHCPGAVMFLFEIGQRRILHVGDFRWNTELMLNQGPLKTLYTNQTRLDELYLDTTYCDERYSLPTQSEAIQATIDVAVRESTLPGKTLFLFGAYTIGKERIYLSVAERLGMRVFVDKNRLRVLQALDWQKERLKLLTTDREETCLWVVPLGHINFKKMGTYVGESSKVFSTRTFDRVVGFRPTGWAMSSGNGRGLVSTRTTGVLTVHGVAYSEHSSFPELIECLDCLKPKKIIPTVSVRKSKEQINLLLGALQHNREQQATK